MTTYLLNSPVLTSFGDYRFTEITLAAAQKILSQGFISAIGHADTATFLSELFGQNVHFNRIKIEMSPGDQAIVFRFQERLPEGEVLDLAKLKTSKYVLGMLLKTQ